jgi:hypothetical protein
MDDFVVAIRAGRVVEGRPSVLKTRAQAIAYCDEFRRYVPSAKPKAIIVADYRAIPIFPPEVADELQRLMTEMNPWVERSAVLVAPDHATNALQVARVVREARNDRRRSFTDAGALASWLGEVLTREEQARVEAFLAETR